MAGKKPDNVTAVVRAPFSINSATCYILGAVVVLFLYMAAGEAADNMPGGVMPYETLIDLPEAVQNVLPRHAQEIYKEAFNSAWEQYADSDKRRGDDSREEVAHKVAWAAVKQTYHKNQAGDWVKTGN